MSRWLDAVVGGWKVSGQATVYSGFPITMQSTITGFAGNGSARANQYRKLKITGRTVITATPTYGWWGNDPSALPCTTPGVDNGVCAYGVPAANTFGNAGIGTERSAAFHGADAAGFKSIRFYESHELQFRVDAYNVGNITSYNNPGRSVSSLSTFGLVQSSRSQQRQIQFALKYKFLTDRRLAPFDSRRFTRISSVRRLNPQGFNRFFQPGQILAHCPRIYSPPLLGERRFTRLFHRRLSGLLQ